MNFYQKDIECMEKTKLAKLQDERLCDTVRRVYENVPYYRKRMQQAGLTPNDIKGTADLHKLPFTTKMDLRDYYPFDTFAVPLDDVCRIHASSGTTGKPIVVGYTKEDIEMWDICVARGMAGVGITNKDIIHVSYGYGLFTGGLGAHGGAQKIGALTVPASVGNTKRQIQLLVDFKSTVLCCTPSYALHLADAMAEEGYTKEDLNLRIGIFGAEPWSEEMRKEIEARLGLKAYDIYGLSEILGPGVSTDCIYKDGLHIQSDHFLAEIIDPETGGVLPYGETGELVFSCITKQAIPLLRYRTRDLCTLTDEVCRCGRTGIRMAKVTGRCDDMLIIRGVNVFPSQIESVLLRFSEVEPHYMIYVDRVNNADTLEIHIEVSEKTFSDEVKKLEQLSRRLGLEIQSVIGISAKIKLVGPKSIARSEGKAKRVVDNRKIF